MTDIDHGKPINGIRPLDDYIAAEVEGHGSVCPCCGYGTVIPGPSGAGRMGICTACYNRARAEAIRARTRDVLSVREYDAARRKAHREGVSAAVGDDEAARHIGNTTVTGRSDDFWDWGAFNG